uniref:non-specific serine/threonine protein kinase n=1 Tax=Parastrongyloides trichosuri TaxID=131310 RepID=A0A0N4ZSG5_PARTI
MDGEVAKEIQKDKNEKTIRLEGSTNIGTGKILLPSSSNYEWIRVEGKGSFGKAILYKRKIDNTFVIIKEIVMHNLSLIERQSALNEVLLLSQLDHRNIISYYDSFEEDGILMIEMEYADGGNLSQFLMMQDEYINEDVIWFIFTQIVDGVCYLHQNNILHRDLKTANIFLTKNNDVKIGDFGISKIMGTNTKMDGAKTVIGTPYYISPEMCEGKSYNESTDIWSLGCVLYEMACLQKTFEATNLPALVNHIMKGDYKPVRGQYSSFLKLLIRDMLKVDASARPSANDIMNLLKNEHKYKNDTGNEFCLINLNKKVQNLTSSSWSALYEFDITSLSLTFHDILPQSQIKIITIGVGKNHKIFVSNDHQVYVHGSNNNGELGLGNRENKFGKAKCIDFLSDKQIVNVDAGDGYSLFQSAQGVVYFSGKKEMSTIEGMTEDVLKPKLIECLLREDIKNIACGPNHAVAISVNGVVFVWGNSDNGRLGIKSISPIEEDIKFIFIPIPLKINLPQGHIITSARCGYDATMLLTNLGAILAMGNNCYNKLNINQRQGFFSSKKGVKEEKDNENIWEPTLLKSFPSRVVDAKIGCYHSGILLESGHIYMFGKNSNGELGIGSLDCKSDISTSTTAKPIKSLLTKGCILLQCGENFSITATIDELYFWGSRGLINTSIKGDLKIEDIEGGTNNENKSILKEIIVTLPSLVLKLESSSNSSGVKSIIKLCGLYCYGKKKVLVQIDTYIPPKNHNLEFEIESKLENVTSRKNFISDIFKKKLTSGKREIRSDEENNALNNQLEEKTTDFDKTNTWLKNEFNDATIIPIKNKATNDDEPVRCLIKEIENLKVLLNEQKSSFNGQENEMKLLKNKITELQTLEKNNSHTDDIKRLILEVTSSIPRQVIEPPPEYSPQEKNNKRFNMSTKICTIL